ncbi:MAG: NYN domain-containing protein [Clostridiaceae bacterium]|jgi:predicted RNA-binding protein with PIN domain|nr:NYN domain-containing protein [Clostridiaceae bacterium]
MEYLLVDGYNVINAWKDVFDLKRETLEECREKLLNILSNYEGYRKINVVIVFDAHMVKGSTNKVEEYDNITVVYTEENQTADNYIERFVYQYGNIHTIRVVTSDYLEQTIVLKHGAARMTPRELKDQVENIHRNMISEFAQMPKNTRNTLASNMDSELLKKLEQMRRGE